MIEVGEQPILWHIMRWYASWGHPEFILCLGYRANAVKEYFLSVQRATMADDFVFSTGQLSCSRSNGRLAHDLSRHGYRGDDRGSAAGRADHTSATTSCSSAPTATA